MTYLSLLNRLDVFGQVEISNVDIREFIVFANNHGTKLRVSEQRDGFHTVYKVS